MKQPPRYLFDERFQQKVGFITADEPRKSGSQQFCVYGVAWSIASTCFDAMFFWQPLLMPSQSTPISSLEGCGCAEEQKMSTPSLDRRALSTSAYLEEKAKKGREKSTANADSWPHRCHQPWRPTLFVLNTPNSKTYRLVPDLSQSRPQ